jgi:hypothetical protein
MADVREVKKAKLFIGMLSNNAALFEEIKKELPVFGRIDFESGIFDWNFTKFYEDEMGSGLKRKFVFFDKKIVPDEIAKIKLKTNEIEKKFAEKGNRKINLDPGYLTQMKVVLASAKDSSHKVYIREGIYGDIALRFRNNSFEPFDYTYSDFKSREYIELFNEMREKNDWA